GATFTVRLPMAASTAALEDAPTGGGPAAARISVLIVDDNRDSAETLAFLLKMEGHEVRTAHDGPEALRLLQGYRPRLILLDLGLPGMSGYEVARRIRSSPDLGEVRLAALTGWGQEEDRRGTREAGFDDHLVKPTDPVEVSALLAELAGAGA